VCDLSIGSKQVVSSSIVVLLFSVGMLEASGSSVAEETACERKARVPLKLNAIVKARSELVLSSIHEARTEYPGLKSGKVLSEDKQGSLIQQKFTVPFLGEATSTFRCTDVAPNRMDYKLVHSNIFTVMDGSWMLSPGLREHSTRVDLSCYVAAKNALPKLILKLMLGRKLGKQLDFVRTTAETKEVQLEAIEKQR